MDVDVEDSPESKMAEEDEGPPSPTSLELELKRRAAAVDLGEEPQSANEWVTESEEEEEAGRDEAGQTSTTMAGGTNKATPLAASKMNDQKLDNYLVQAAPHATPKMQNEVSRTEYSPEALQLISIGPPTAGVGRDRREGRSEWTPSAWAQSQEAKGLIGIPFVLHFLHVRPLAKTISPGTSDFRISSEWSLLASYISRSAPCSYITRNHNVCSFKQVCCIRFKRMGNLQATTTWRIFWCGGLADLIQYGSL
jgi:hypothetical protein